MKSAELASKTIELAKTVMDIEARSIQQAYQRLDVQFENSVELLAGCQGRVVVSGVGKSGLIGQKISATFASTGTPSFYIHASEAVHGDLGRICQKDIVMLLSKSGATDEVVNLAARLRNDAVPVISITQSPTTHLGRLSRFVVSIGKSREACPHNLAPTASTAAMLAIGDALAIAVSQAKAFTAEDFQRSHPKGALGQQLQSVSEIIRFRVGDNAAVITDKVDIRTMLEQTESMPRRCGAVLVTNNVNQLIGIITDADLRRSLLLPGETQILSKRVSEIMTKDPVTVRASAQVREATRIIQERRLDELPVVDEHNQPVGILDIQDLISMKIISE